MTKFGDKTVLHLHVQVTSSFSQPLYNNTKNLKSCIFKLPLDVVGIRFCILPIRYDMN